MTTYQWRERIKELEGEGHELVLETIDKCVKEHGSCCGNVCDIISLWFTKYAKDGRVTYSEAVRLNRMLELVEDIDYELEQSTTEEKQYLDVLLAALLAFYSKAVDKSFPLSLLNGIWASDGVHYSDRIWNNKQLLLTYIQTDLKRAFARGDSLEDIIKQMKKRFNTSENALERLIQTEATAYESEMLRDWMASMGYEQYQWITILDGKQCGECEGMNRLVFRLEDYERGVTAPPLHSHCRCQISPIV